MSYINVMIDTISPNLLHITYLAIIHIVDYKNPQYGFIISMEKTQPSLQMGSAKYCNIQ